MIYLLTEPRDSERAADLIRSAIGRAPYLGNRYFPAVTFAMLQRGTSAETLAYLEEERRALLEGRRNVRSDIRARTLDILGRCEEVARR